EKFPVALSTEEPLGIEGVAIYPNPAQDGKVRITPIPGVENGRISLLGVEGRVLRNLNWNGELKEVQLGQPGLYILQLDDGKGKIKQFKVINN
ncbi:MAG: T9SS type A sorting domain-containing protein, partial [Cytophagales bacterium]|nr:T9SS type A sorting domain-containing protein [Cytophagales bacterium]